MQVVGFLGATSLSVCFYLFPSGRFVPSWSRWLLIGWVIYEGAERFFPSSPLSPLGHVPVRSLGLFFALLASVVAAQIYRYQRVSTPRERQQTRWVVFGCTVGLLGLIAVVFLSTLFPVFFQPGTLAFFPGYALLLLSMLCIPLSIGIAILRSRLWEIDLIINRTLVYGTLTVLLALIYAGFVIGLGELLRLLTGQLGQSPIVIVVSTLAIAALFQPLRRRMQRAIDRRFYRRKYDAARTLAAFSATLRNEVDLTHLKEQLLAVVQETMQPNHVSLWLREPDRKFPHPK